MNALPALLLPFLLLAAVAEGWLGVYLDTERDEAVISEVIPGSPADKGGLHAGDLLLAVDDTATGTRDEFVAAIRAKKAGDRVKIKIRRGTDESVLVVKLGQRADEGAPAPGAKAGPADKKPGAPSQPAAEVAPVAPRTATTVAKKPYLGLSVRATDAGVVIDRLVPAGPADGTSLVPGDRITSLSDQTVASLADIDRILATLAPGKKVAIGVQGAQGTRSVLLTLGSREDAEATAAAPTAKRVEAGKPSQPAAAPDKASAGEHADLEAQLDALRRELRDLRRQLEELRRQSQREEGGRE